MGKKIINSPPPPQKKNWKKREKGSVREGKRQGREKKKREKRGFSQGDKSTLESLNNFKRDSSFTSVAKSFINCKYFYFVND